MNLFFIKIFLFLSFFFVLPETLSQQIYPSQNCSGYQLIDNICSQTSCHDFRCHTCSQNSISDCLLCDLAYNLTRSQSQGSCLSVCPHTQLQTDHYLKSNISIISSENDVCLDPINNCSDSKCLSCLDGHPDTCLLCEDFLFPRYYRASNSTKCMNCSLSMINCLECEWGSYCSLCKSYSDSSTGFLISNDGSSCKACEDIVTTCAKCDGKRKCLECREGYYLFDDGAHGVCKPCLTYCNICTNDTICLQCKTNYMNLDPTTCGPCNAFLSSCLSCSDDSTCLECEQGYYLTIDKSKL